MEQILTKCIASYTPNKGHRWCLVLMSHPSQQLRFGVQLDHVFKSLDTIFWLNKQNYYHSCSKIAICWDDARHKRSGNALKAEEDCTVRVRDYCEDPQTKMRALN